MSAPLLDQNERNSDREKKSKSKPVLVYTRISAKAKTKEVLEKYLQLRMENPENVFFEVIDMTIETVEDNINTVAVLQFPSKKVSVKAIYLLHKSNRSSRTKVHCFLNHEEAIAAVARTKDAEDKLFGPALKQIVERADKELQQHGDKIQGILDGIARISTQITENVSLEVFEGLKAEEAALNDKKKELELQRGEYQKHLLELKSKIQELRGSPKAHSELQRLRKNFGIECNRLRTALPMYARRSDILKTIEANQVSVVLGETGSGKSTQMTQYLLGTEVAQNGLIACTQPRKIAATSLATHVASEMASSVGQVIGYQVGMRAKISRLTKVIYMTDHILLNECLQDRKLSKYSYIIIDEAHERSIFTDLLLGMIKACLPERPDLRVIVTSATINPDVFVSYFGGPSRCPVLTVSGRTFPVDVVWSSNKDEDSMLENFVDRGVAKAVELHRKLPIEDGDILVFLTSPLDTEKACEKFTDDLGKTANYQCLPLHGKLQPNEQQLVFEPNKRGTRKIVFATNSAETSITIPGIKFVIDTGLAKEMKYDPKRNMNSLTITTITQSSANQRKGRAGRTAPGKCYRLYSESTFNSMEPNSIPELLRVHLGQALLKLLDLGVNPLAFEFVESPSSASLRAAMNVLQDIGAVKNTRITELGKWIAKLPVEPRLGSLIKMGIESDVPKEALVIAAACSSSSIFYRSGTEEEKKQADRRKTRFCSEGGDLVTVLNVYREWEEVEEKQKGQWCFENSINGKSIRGVRETVNEMMTILKKELKEEVKYQFKATEEGDRKMKLLLFCILKTNICFFLGHDQAGYLSIQLNQHVQIHPSSALKALGLREDWVVYQQLLQTSQDFVVNVTPVASELVEKALSRGILNVDLKSAESKRVTLVQRLPMGQRTFRSMVGPRHQTRKQTEVEISSACEDGVIILEAIRNKFEFQLYCNEQHATAAKKLLGSTRKKMVEPLLRETIEEPVGNPGGGVRAVLGAGGTVLEILMPQQYTTVVVSQTVFGRNELTENDVENVLAKYGEIRSVSKFRKSGKIWGKVTFRSDKDAYRAVCEMKDKSDVKFTVSADTTGVDKSRTEFTLVLSWCRRPNKGFGYVTFARPEEHARATLLSHVIIGGRLLRIQNSKTRENQIYIKGFEEHLLDEKFKEEFAAAMGIPGLLEDNRLQVVIPKLNIKSSPDEVEGMARLLTAEAMRFAPKESFTLKVLQPKTPNTVQYRAFLVFTNPDQGQAALNGMQGLPINSAPLRIVPDLSTSVFVRRNVYEATRDDIERCVQAIVSRERTVKIETKVLRSGNISLNVKAADAKLLAYSKKALTEVINGDQIECGSDNTLQLFFTREGRGKLQEIAEKTKAVIFVNERTLIVSIQGREESRRKARQEMDKYLSGLQGTVPATISLKGGGMPPGLMKLLLTRYGPDLDGLKAETGILSVSLQFLSHTLSIRGAEKNVEATKAKIVKISEEIKKGSAREEDELPDCGVCFCTVETQDLCRLEYCGHAYCNCCLTNMLKFAIKDKGFPINCAADGCSKPVVLEDIRMKIKEGCTTMKALTQSSVDAFVAKNQDKFKYCITPDCEMVYKTSTDGKLFTCGECQVKICTTCSIEFHDGMTCAVYKSLKDDKSNIQEWLRENPEKRKRCPNCTTVIEKIEGCNNMTCIACHKHICWRCLKYFDTDQQCYGHLRTVHGGFM